MAERDDEQSKALTSTSVKALPPSLIAVRIEREEREREGERE